MSSASWSLSCRRSWAEATGGPRCVAKLRDGIGRGYRGASRSCSAAACSAAAVAFHGGRCSCLSAPSRRRASFHFTPRLLHFIRALHCQRARKQQCTDILSHRASSCRPSNRLVSHPRPLARPDPSSPQLSATPSTPGNCKPQGRAPEAGQHAELSLFRAPRSGGRKGSCITMPRRRCGRPRSIEMVKQRLIDFVQSLLA